MDDRFNELALIPGEGGGGGTRGEKGTGREEGREKGYGEWGGGGLVTLSRYVI